MTKKMFYFIALLVAFATLAAACGGGDDVSGDDQAVIDAVSAQLTSQGDFPEGTVDLPCIATAMVSGLGGAAVLEEKYGLTVETIAAGQDVSDVEIPKEQAISVADDMMGCGMMNAMVSEMTGDGMASDEATCLGDKLDSDIVRDIIASEMMNREDAAVIEEAASTAMIPSIMSAMVDCEIDPSALGL